MRDLLLRVCAQQNPDGDWPQWFMFFERERDIRPGDSHGDIVFWPLLRARALPDRVATTPRSSTTSCRSSTRAATDAAEPATVWQHVERALALIAEARRPRHASRRLRPRRLERLAAAGRPGDARAHCAARGPSRCTTRRSTTLAEALRRIGRAERGGARSRRRPRQCEHDFQRLLIADGVLAGYALLPSSDGRVEHLLHPTRRDDRLHYSLLPMIHAILADLLTPEQARDHLQLIDDAPARRPTARACSTGRCPTTAGRSASSSAPRAAPSSAARSASCTCTRTCATPRRWRASAMRSAFFHALRQANPIGIRSIVPARALRQANCYYSSSDAAFADRYEASERVRARARRASRARGRLARLLERRRHRARADRAAFPRALERSGGASASTRSFRRQLDGLRVQTTLLGRPIEVVYRARGKGCGVTSIVLNGEAVPYSRRANPHRPGAALVTNSVLMPKLAAKDNVLAIELG